MKMQMSRLTVAPSHPSPEISTLAPSLRPRASVRLSAGYKLELTFTSGETGVYDCAPLLDFGVFSELKDEQYFRTVRVVNGTVAWPHEQDICPDTLYLDSCRTSNTIPA